MDLIDIRTIEKDIQWNLAMEVSVYETLKYHNRLDLIPTYLWWQFPRLEPNKKIDRVFKKRKIIVFT